MMWMTDPSGSLTYLNPLWSEFTGQPQEEALDSGAWNAVHPDDREQSQRIFIDANAARAAVSDRISSAAQGRQLSLGSECGRAAFCG